ncbi:MAG: hypothetical protein IJD46_01035 [Bacilli bacterium]|nr:hypothetical protein [Bacilli bacterium]
MSGNEGISVADALALRNSSGENSGWGDNGAWWIIILILFAAMGGWGRNGGFGGNGGGDSGYNACCTPATMQGMTDAFNFSQLDNGVRGLERGMCDGFYATNNSINNVLSAIQNCCCTTQREMADGFCGVEKSIMNASFQNQSGFNALGAQIAQCCCDMRYDMASQFCDTRNTIQNTTRDIIENQNNNTRSILDFLVKDKLDALRDENQALRFQASQTAQNAFITANQEAQTAELIRRLGADYPVPSYLVQPPTPINFPINGCGQVQFGHSGSYGGSCGCGSCC